ncbi:Trm112 family protein [Actinomyces israelii]|uniref:Trm112 family protein n=1 Tax=Actinomyces israelii TaxID=1659 RepID=UPI000A845081|nr:hypothetical protein [Actinomyces israelii]
MSVVPDSPVPTGIAPWVRQILRCPATGGGLVDGVGPDGAACLESPAGALSYPVHDGVPILLAHEAAPLRRPAHPAAGRRPGEGGRQAPAGLFEPISTRK